MKRWTPPPLGTRYGPWTLTAHLGLVDGRRTVTATHTCGHTHTGPLTELTNTPCPDCPTKKVAPKPAPKKQGGVDVLHRLDLIQDDINARLVADINRRWAEMTTAYPVGCRWGELTVVQHLGDCDGRWAVNAVCDDGHVTQVTFGNRPQPHQTRCRVCRHLKEKRVQGNYPAGAWFHGWTITGHRHQNLVIRHHCGRQRTVNPNAPGPIRCNTCARQQRAIEVEQAKEARQARIDALKSEYPVGSVHGGWTITTHKGMVGHGLAVTAVHTCGATIDTYAAKLATHPPRCACQPAPLNVGAPRGPAGVRKTAPKPARPQPPGTDPGTRCGSYTVVRWRGYSPGGDRVDLVCDCGHRFAVLVDKLRAGLAECRQCAKRKAS